MSRLIASTFAALALALVSFVSRAAPLTLEAQHELAWRVACEGMRHNCFPFFIRPPIVAYALLGPGLHGAYYFGSQNILINLRLIGEEDAVPVIVHEMIHYLQYDMGRMDGDFVDHCSLEKQAFNLTFALSQLHDLDPDYSIVVKWEQRAALYDCPV